MAPLQKQALTINFASGVNTKTDPFQVAAGQFLDLQNSIFDKGGLLQKRNGFGKLGVIPDASFLTTFNGDLTSVGSGLSAYSTASSSFANKGSFEALNVRTMSVVRNSLNQTQADSAAASNGVTCIVYTESTPVAGVLTAVYKYAVADSASGQYLVNPTVIPSGSGTITGAPRVFILGNYFIILISATVAGTPHLQYIAINTYNSSLTPVGPTDLSTTYTPSTGLSFDAVVANNSLYIAYNSSSTSVKMTFLTSTLGLGNTVTFAGRVATLMSVAADMAGVTPIIYASFYDSASHTGYTLAVDHSLNTVLAPTQIIPSGNIANITCTADSGVCRVYYEVTNTYGYDGALYSNYIQMLTVTQAGTVSSAASLIRSLGLASKAFLINGVSYVMGVYASVTQPTYFLIDQNSVIAAKLAYSNGGGYKATGLPSVAVSGTTATIAYEYRDLIQAVNKTQGATSANGIYAQTGINLASFDFGTSNLSSAEIGSNLHLSGGLLWAYDGVTPVEQGFHLWPDSIEVSTSGSGGSITAQTYFYQVTYEWTDNQGNIHRSAPSIPVSVTTTGATSSNTVHIPTLRVTAKDNVNIVVYRWSAGQQNYYQATSIQMPTLNDKTVDYIDFLDTQSDSQILGNNLIYTTGGVLENIGPPATAAVALFDNRLWLIDAEDRNLAWFSKQVIEATPVEMSDLLTQYVAPTTGGRGSTGPTRCLFPMDDKLIFFKKDAMYYISGRGPDITGTNNQYSDAIFIASTIGSSNQRSIVLVPQGLMFESDKGIWLLGRDLSTSYIGAPVEGYTSAAHVLSAVSVPGTNQVRFTMDSGVVLMYDYYFNQWGVFTGVPSISSTIYGDLHTYLDSHGNVCQETPGKYLDGSAPVLMSFTSSWISLAGLQGFERFYQLYLLGTYYTPFKLNVGISYDFVSGAPQTIQVAPDNYSPAYGANPNWGSSNVTNTWGGPSRTFEARVFPSTQKCESFQITVQEIYDPTFGVAAGAGLSLSAMNIVAGMKKSYRTQSAKRSFG